MEFLYTPWRSDYTSSARGGKKETLPAEECVFCNQLAQNDDAKNFILKRFSHTAVLFNRYPYNAGHLLVVPLEHISHLENMSVQTRAQIMEATTASTAILQQRARPEGFNIGINMGRLAGASIPAHLHMHIVPRYMGDTNFLPTLGNTKVISFDLVKMYDDLKPHFDAVAL